jgi:RNA polymerase sigma factor (sigma-70 family)
MFLNDTPKEPLSPASHPQPSEGPTGDSTAPLEPAELVQRAANGDPAAWQEIMRRYSGLVTAKVRTFRLQDADALDAFQTTWLRLAENIHRIQHPERLGSWLATTAARECVHILRHAKRTLTLTYAIISTLTEPSASPEQHVIHAQTAQTLRTLIAQLPPRRRRLLRALFTDHPPSYAELSRTTAIPLGSIGPTRNRALHQLRQLFLRACGTPIDKCCRCRARVPRSGATPSRSPGGSQLARHNPISLAVAPPATRDAETSSPAETMTWR